MSYLGRTWVLPVFQNGIMYMYYSIILNSKFQFTIEKIELLYMKYQKHIIASETTGVFEIVS